MKKPSHVAAPRRATVSAPAAEHAVASVNQPSNGTAVAPSKRGRSGRAVQFWMYDQDRRILRELSAWLAGQGVRPSDSLVIRTALRYAKADSQFLDAYHEAAKLDGRLKSAADSTSEDA